MGIWMSSVLEPMLLSMPEAMLPDMLPLLPIVLMLPPILLMF
jgi:hypothetical protein